MNSKNLSIGILTITALILLIANLLPVQTTVLAADAVKDRDYAIVTAKSVTGGESVYVTDNKSGLMAVFAWDAARRAFVVKDVRPVADAFQP